MDNKLRYDYLLPIGSIVKVKDLNKSQMVIGVLQKGRAVPNKTFDYASVPYPEGLHNPMLNLGFDHKDIEKVIFRGYEDDERKAFLILMEAVTRSMEKKQEEKGEG